jgi:hypothetical protein
MGALRDEFEALALELTNGDFVDAKYPITITNAGNYDPVTEAVTGGTSQVLSATLLEFDQREIDGSNIKIGDKLALIVNSELTIDIKDNTSSFIYDLSAGGMGIYSGIIIRGVYDPLGVTVTLQLRGA